VLVRPGRRRKIEPAVFFDENLRPQPPALLREGTAQVVADSDHRPPLVESGSHACAALLVGQARRTRDVVAPEIAADKEAPMFPDLNAHEEKVRAGLVTASGR